MVFAQRFLYTGMSRNFSSTIGRPNFESRPNQPATTAFPGDDDFDNVSTGYQAKPVTSTKTAPTSAVSYFSLI